MQVPGREPGGHAARQLAVGRDQRRRPAGRLRHLAQDERDGLGLVLGAGRLQDGDAGQRLRHLLACGAGHEPVPALGGARRAASPRSPGTRARAAPHRASAPAAAARPRARTPSASSSFLRPNCGCSGCSGTMAFQLSSSSVWSSAGSTRAPLGRPATTLSSSVTAGTLLMTPATITGASGGAARSRCACASTRCLSCCIFETRPCSARCAGQNSVTIFRNCERPFPVLGERVGHQRLHARGIDVLDLHRVHQPGKLARQLGRLRRRVRRRRPRASDQRHDQPGERQLPLDVADRAAQLARGVGGEVLRAGQRAQVLFRRADDGPDLGQQQRRPPAASRNASCRARVARRVGSSKRRVGELQRTGPRSARDGQVARQQRLGQRRQERPCPAEPCRCGCAVRKRWPLLLSDRLQRRSGTARLRASAAGVPTCIHMPSMRMP